MGGENHKIEKEVRGFASGSSRSDFQWPDTVTVQRAERLREVCRRDVGNRSFLQRKRESNVWLLKRDVNVTGD